MSDGKKPVSHKKQTEGDRKVYDLQSEAVQLASNGVFCGKIDEPELKFIEAPCEKVIKGQNNSYIVMGRDRVNTLDSGYGGKGLDQSSAIDLVVGRMGREGDKSVNSAGEDLYCYPSFEKDAARIYISQRTDVDDNFKLTDGGVGNIKERSAITLKADGVRVVGREGIKLVTWGDQFNSRGGTIGKPFGIDLIAGNDDTDLQPIPKGKNLALALNEIYNQISTLNGFVGNLAFILSDFHEALQSHTHPIPTMKVLIPTPSGPAPLADTMPGVTQTSPPVESAAQTSVGRMNNEVFDGCSAQIKNISNKKSDYLVSAGKLYINSTYNKVN
jgi:hypothetical protein